MTNKHLVIGIGLVCGVLLFLAITVSVSSSRDRVAATTPPSDNQSSSDVSEEITDANSIPGDEPTNTPSRRPTVKKTIAPTATAPAMGAFKELVTDPGTTGGLAERKTVVIFDRTGLRELWSQIYAATDPASGTTPELPVVDFTKYAVVAGFMGEQSTGGASIALKTVEDLSDKTLITFEETTPGASCNSTEAITKPFVLVAVRNAGKQFNTDVLRTVKDCQ